VWCIQVSGQNRKCVHRPLKKHSKSLVGEIGRILGADQHWWYDWCSCRAFFALREVCRSPKSWLGNINRTSLLNLRARLVEWQTVKFAFSKSMQGFGRPSAWSYYAWKYVSKSQSIQLSLWARPSSISNTFFCHDEGGCGASSNRDRFVWVRPQIPPATFLV
jgi:hypothetical protein